MAWEIQELDWSRLQPPDKPKGSWFWALAIAVGLVLMWVGIANAHSADRPELNDWLMASGIKSTVYAATAMMSCSSPTTSGAFRATTTR
jgi:hypothetical protein